MIFCFIVVALFLDDIEGQPDAGNIKIQALFIVLIFAYYVTTCGIERIFQSMTYSFGLCGPLKLNPAAAVITDNAYNGGFMSGRILSIFIGETWHLFPHYAFFRLIEPFAVK